MARREELRVHVNLHVNVYGTDAQGKPFKQSAVSEIGLRLRDIYCFNTVGETLIVEHGGKRAKYRAMWIGGPGTEHAGQIGLRRLPEERAIFHLNLPHLAQEDIQIAIPPAPQGALQQRDPVAAVKPIPFTPRPASEPKGAAERRRFPRYPCSGDAVVSETGLGNAARGRISDLSLGGCYVEMLGPYPKGAMVAIEIQLRNRKFQAEAEVRSAHPNMGMCLQFRRMSAQDGYTLQQLIRDLSGQMVDAAPGNGDHPAPASQAVSVVEPDNGPVMDQLLRWFALHDVLTREEFLRMVKSHAGP